MELTSLGCRTDLIFPEFEGEVEDRGSYLRIRTPANPSYWWGNYLLFEHSPGEGDFERWTDLFEKEIGVPPETEHIVFAWDVGGEQAVVSPFFEAGFKLSTSVVMTANELTKPEKFNNAVEMRVLKTDDDFAELLDLQILLDLEEGFEGAGHRLFLLRNLERYRKMIAAGLGEWFGAYSDGKLVSCMGLFYKNDLARYQGVATHPEYRRRGIAGTLTYFVGRYGLERFEVDTLVIVADENYFAKDVYASVGFKKTEVVEALERPPQQ